MDVIKLCKALHKDLSRQFKSSANTSISEKRTPLSQIQEPKQHLLRLSHSSSQPSPIISIHSNFSDRSISPTRVVNPPSRFVSESFWKQSVAAMVPPIPTKKPSACSQSLIDDSLIHYQPLELSDLKDDISKISDVGKPKVEENSLSQSYQSKYSQGESFQHLTKSYSSGERVLVERNHPQNSKLDANNHAAKSTSQNASLQQSNGMMAQFDRFSKSYSDNSRSRTSARSRSYSPSRSVERSVSPNKSVSFIDANTSNLSTPKESPKKEKKERFENIVKPKLNDEEQISLITVMISRNLGIK